MAQHAIPHIRSSATTPPAVPLDEDLWFGISNDEAAEKAAANSMAAVAGKIVGAKPFPEAARRLAELASHESTPIQAYVSVIEQDAGLSSRLLRMVNSSGFSLRQRCTSVRHAVTILGSKHLHRLATAAAVLDFFDTDSALAVRLLEHSAIAGALCRYLGAHLNLPSEDLFTIGMLHDIGKLMMLDAFGDRYHELVDGSEDGADLLHPLERAEFGFDHGVLAAHVLKAWQIPDPIPKIVAWHHEPARALRSSTLHASLVQTLRFADVLVHALAGGATRADVPRLAKHDAASYLDISEAQLDALWDALTQLYAQAVRHGEASSEAPAADASAPPRDRPERSTEAASVPKRYACVACGDPGFGSTCPACRGDLCPQHPPGPSGWCVVCAKEYTEFEAASRFPLDWRRSWIALSVLAAVALVVGFAAEGAVAPALTGSLVLALGLGVAIVIGKRSYSRTLFLRARPNRAHE